MKMINNIQALLYQHDCVVVPGFGGFVANYFPSQIDAEFGIITPPSKHISFNKNLKTNDGLLVQQLVASEGITYDEALAQITLWVDDLKTTLHTLKRFDFEGIGVFFKGKEDEVLFVPDGAQNYFAASFGLKRVFARPIASKSKIEESTIIKPVFTKTATPIISLQSENKEESDSKETKVVALRQSNKKWWAVAAVIPLVFFISYAGLQNDFRNPSQWELSNLNPFDSNQFGIYQNSPQQALDVGIETTKNNLELAVNSFEEENAAQFGYDFVNDKVNENGINISLTELDNTNVVVTKPLNYFVIAGCFGQKRNALKLVKDLKNRGYESFVYDYKNGLHRVAVQGFEMKSTARVFLQEIRTKVNKGAWLLKK